MGISRAHCSRRDGFLAVIAAKVGKGRPRAAGGTQCSSAGFKSEMVMILSLRKRHRRVFAVLGLSLPLAFAYGIAARRDVPSGESLPPELSSWTQSFTATDHERDDLFGKSPVRVRLWREQ